MPDDEVYLQLHLACGHSRKTITTYPKTELEKPEFWVGGLAMCNECKLLIRITRLTE